MHRLITLGDRFLGVTNTLVVDWSKNNLPRLRLNAAEMPVGFHSVSGRETHRYRPSNSKLGDGDTYGYQDLLFLEWVCYSLLLRLQYDHYLPNLLFPPE